MATRASVCSATSRERPTAIAATSPMYPTRTDRLARSGTPTSTNAIAAYATAQRRLAASVSRVE